MLSIVAATGPHPGPRLALFLASVKAGFPSPAENYAEGQIEVGAFAVRNPASSYVLKVSGNSMQDAGVLPGDYVVVDRSLVPAANDLVIAEINGDFTLKQLGFEHGQPILLAANKDYPPIRCASGESLVIFGVVSSLFRILRP